MYKIVINIDPNRESKKWRKIYARFSMLINGQCSCSCSCSYYYYIIITRVDVVLLPYGPSPLESEDEVDEKMNEDPDEYDDRVAHRGQEAGCLEGRCQEDGHHAEEECGVADEPVSPVEDGTEFSARVGSATCMQESNCLFKCAIVLATLEKLA